MGRLQVTDGPSHCSLLSVFVFLRPWAALADSVKACGAEALALLCRLKAQESTGSADCSRLRAALDTVMGLGEVSVVEKSIIDDHLESSIGMF